MRKKDSSENNQEKRYRLNKNEEEMLLHWRKTGAIPSQMIIHSDRNVIKLKEQYGEVKRLYELALKELELHQSRETIMSELQGADLTKKVIRVESRKGRSSKKSQSIAVAVASDWHYEERVDPATVNGLNSFNVSVAKKRIEYFFERIVYLTQLMRHETEIEHLVLALLGDLISGYIHEEFMELNQMSPTNAILDLVRILKQGIDFLVDEGQFTKITVPCAYGNHGRTTQKKKIGTGHLNSFEVMLYEFLATIYQDHAVVDVMVPRGYHTYLDMFGRYLVRFHHGDSVKYYGGVGGITIPVNKAIAQWNRSKNAFLDVFGHFHQLRDGGNWICNGSLIGYNAFALSIKADFELPQQAFFTIEKTKGKTFTAPIFLEER